MPPWERMAALGAMGPVDSGWVHALGNGIIDGVGLDGKMALYCGVTVRA
jgi:hypothetical protein